VYIINTKGVAISSVKRGFRIVGGRYFSPEKILINLLSFSNFSGIINQGIHRGRYNVRGNAEEKDGDLSGRIKIFRLPARHKLFL